MNILINNSFSEELISMLSVFSQAEKKAIQNIIIVPLILLKISQNALVSFCWILMLVVVYLFIEKEKKENARVFFKYLKNIFLGSVAVGIFFLFSTIIA